MKMLSVLMPVFDEKSTIHQIVHRVMEVQLPKELVIVDDFSKDGTWGELQILARDYPQIRLFRHDRNRGKGAALRTALRYIKGDVAIIQDADLEYDPEDYLKLIQPIEKGIADVVYGSRFTKGFEGVSHLTHAAANRFLTWLSNRLNGLKLTDMETCYKMFKTELVRGLCLSSERFAIEPELTAAFVKMKARIVEVPISYAGRSENAGKKIGFRDGLEAIWAIAKFNWFVQLKFKQEDPQAEDREPQ